MTTAIKPTKDAKFFTNMSNARRALKKIFNCSTEVANSLINVEPFEDGGRYWFSEEGVTRAANWFSEASANRADNSSVAVDKLTTVEIPAAPVVPEAPEAPKASKVRSEIRNGVRRPIKGLCAEVWQALDDLLANELPTIKHVRDLAQAKNWNLNNATIEFYVWRKFHGLNNKKAK